MKRTLTTFLLLAVSFIAFADCDQFYPKGVKIQPFAATELCNEFFVTQYDETLKRALFSSELLAPSGHTLHRKDAFHADKRIPNPIKPTYYFGTGFDRGHLVPADDATTHEEMFSTFVMTNMTPQNPRLNRVAWKALEIRTRKIASEAGVPVIVVTGALYEQPQKKMKDIPIPSGYFKIIYVDDKAPIAYYAENNSKAFPHKVKISWVKHKTSMKFPEE